jgi:hypothetical protein
MTKMVPVCVSINGKEIMFFAEVGLTNDEYIRQATVIYNKHYRKPKGQRMLDLLVRFIQEGKPISDFQLEIQSLNLDPEMEYDFGHLLALVESLKHIED